MEKLGIGTVFVYVFFGPVRNSATFMLCPKSALYTHVYNLQSSIPFSQQKELKAILTVTRLLCCRRCWVSRPMSLRSLEDTEWHTSNTLVDNLHHIFQHEAIGFLIKMDMNVCTCANYVCVSMMRCCLCVFILDCTCLSIICRDFSND